MINIYDTPTEILESRNWKFNRRNVNKIAWEYAAEIKEFDSNLRRAVLKDEYDRLMWVIEKH